MNKVKLFIDESGPSNPRVTSSPCYVVSSCRIKTEKQNDLRIKADQIKFKYWGNTEVIFHSREINRKEGIFENLEDDKVQNDFKKDLMGFLNSGGYSMLVTVVDRDAALKMNWNEDKVLQETANVIIRNFLLSLIGSETMSGSIVIESATSKKDFVYHRVLSHYLSRGIEDLGVSFEKIQSALTEISFVTKKNLDIEEQIADLMAYGAKLKFIKKPKSDLSPYEKSLLSIFDSKLYKVETRVNRNGRKYLNNIDSYKILP